MIFSRLKKIGVSHETFRNEDTGYTVARLGNGAAGTMPFVAAGGEYKFYGRFVNHAEHEEQSGIAKYGLPPPDGEKKIAAFIGGGLVFGAGPADAKKIVKKIRAADTEHFGAAPRKTVRRFRHFKAKGRAYRRGVRGNFRHAGGRDVLPPVRNQLIF